MLFRIDFEIAIYPDRVQISDERHGRFVDYAADAPFSSPDQLIADAVYFEHALAKAMRKMLSGGYLMIDPQARIRAGGRPLGTQDRQAIRRVLRDIGFTSITFPDGKQVVAAPELPPEIAALLRQQWT